MEIKHNQTSFHGAYLNLIAYLFYQNILKYFNDFKNYNFSVLWLKWTQTMEMKQSQTFFHGTYSNVTLYLFLSKYIEVFQFLEICSILWLKNQKKWKWNKIRNFSMGHIQIWHFFHQNILKYLSDFQNWNFWILWLKWTQTMGMKQTQTFFPGTYSNLMLFFIGRKILENFNDFYN